MTRAGVATGHHHAMTLAGKRDRRAVFNDAPPRHVIDFVDEMKMPGAGRLV